MAFFRSVVRSLNLQNSAQKSPIYIMSCMMVRNISTMEVTKNITLFSNEKKTGKIINLKFEEPPDKPLVVMLSWLLAKKKHIIKHAEFYLTKGFDVVNVSVSPWQLLWPVKGTQLVVMDLLKFLESNASYNPLVVHGFSVGGYVWSEALVQIAAEQKRYQHILDRIIGQVWDSLADITEIPVGFPTAVFPENKVLESALRQYIIYHLKTFDKVATCHYVRGSQMFHTNIVKAPALFFISKSDPIGAEASNRRVRENWENMGIQTYWKCWDKSPHVGHFHKHPQEYIAELEKFIESIGFNTQREQISKVQAKL